MSQDYRTRYGEMRESDPTSPNLERDKSVTENYPGHSNTRNVIFERPDGRRFFLNYSYLVFCEELEPGTSIVLLFTTHTVKLNGLRLTGLLTELASHTPKVIASTDSRYNVTIPDVDTVVNEIILTPNA